MKNRRLSAVVGLGVGVVGAVMAQPAFAQGPYGSASRS